MKTKVLPGKQIRVLNDQVFFYSVYDESLIFAFKESKLKWDKSRRAWYADLHDFQNVHDFLEKLSSVLAYFPQNEVIYATHFINSFYSRLSNIVELSRKENSDFPVPLPDGLSLYPYQRAGVEFLVNRQNVLLADAMGLGKEEFVGNRVWTPEGRRRIGDLKVGDRIFGPSGQCVTVVGVFPQGRKKLYRVTFDDNCSVLVGLEHLWLVIDKNDNRYVLTTEQIMKRPDMKELKIPITRPLYFSKKTKKKFPYLSPYLSGLILGNEVLLNSNSGKNFICDGYKYSSLRQRVLFLQGFLDGIKKLKVKGSEIHIYIPKFKTRRDIAEIVHSLGGLAIEKRKTKTLIIKLPKKIPPFRNRDIKYSPSENLTRKFKSIKYAKTDEAVCIQVDCPDCLYLTEYAIVTHNTVQVIGYFNYESKKSGQVPKSLVICPSSVKYNWLKELNKWSINQLNVEVLEGKNGFEQNPDVDVYICNYDILQDKEFKNLNCIVLDEAHYIKNLQAQRTREVQRICKANSQAKIIALTGTPMLNRPQELFPILNLLLPQRFDNFFRFAFKYCAAHKKQIQTREGLKEFWDFSGASNTEELGRLLRATVMLRREKSQVLKELPEKIRTVIPVKKKPERYFWPLRREPRE